MGTADAPTFPLDRKWPFRIALGVWLAVGVGSWFLVDGMGRPGQVVLAGLWVIGLGLLLRQFLLSLFGPVLAYDVLRVGRKSRHIWARVAYACVLALVFAWIYFAWLSFARYRGGGQIRPKDMAKLAETYFAAYMVVQFIMVAILTPASVAGSIADEKERRTLEFLLATDLRDREILFGKLASRVGNLILFLFAGLPILALMQFFGGIDPDLVIAGFTATVLIVLTLAALGMAASVLSRKARDAIALTYLAAVAYIVLSLIVYVIAMIPVIRAESVVMFGYTITSEDAAYVLVCGNPLFMVPYVLETRSRAGADLFTALGHFSLFHLIAIAFMLTWSGMKLRSIALAQTFGSTRRSLLRWATSRGKSQKNEKRKTSPVRRVPAKSSRPAVGDSPILWKEVFVDIGLRIGGFGKFVVFGLVIFSFVPVGFIFWFSFIDPPRWGGTGLASQWDHFGDGMNAYVRGAGSVAATLVFLAIAIRGSGAISGERDRQSLEVLLTTPLAAKTIIWGKWWGCMLGMRWAWAWLFVIWVLGLASGGVHPVMFPAALLSMAIYASGFAWIGLYCSVTMRTTLKSTMCAMVFSMFAGGGYFLLFVMCCVIPFSFASSSGRDLDVFVDFLCSFSPPVNLGWLPIQEFKERELSLSSNHWPYVQFWLLGLVAWALLSLILSKASIAKFRKMANRDTMVPERPPRRRSPPPLPPRNDG
jgi:ABC-type transport system involved in multi-copper enzyme maturation permease subunit